MLFYGTQKTKADSFLIEVSERIVEEATGSNPRETVVMVVSEDKDLMASLVALGNHVVSLKR